MEGGIGYYDNPPIISDINGDGKKEISNVNRGTKNLMQEIQGEIKEEGFSTDTDGIEDINIEDVE